MEDQRVNGGPAQKLLFLGEREKSTHGDRVLFSSVGLCEGFRGVRITRNPYLCFFSWQLNQHEPWGPGQRLKAGKSLGTLRAGLCHAVLRATVQDAINRVEWSKWLPPPLS